MAIRLVNTIPGSTSESQKPGDFAQIGLRSDDSVVLPGTLRVTMGTTGIVLGSALPHLDQQLAGKGAIAQLETTERRNPVSGSITPALVSGALHLSKTDDLDNNLSVYAITAPIESGASVMGYFKFLKSTWTLFSPDWCNLSNMTGVYLGLEHGGHNTGCFVFLRDDGADGSLVYGGPLQTFGGARPAQNEIAGFDWAGVADDTQIEVWIVFNNTGHPSPFVPANTPVVEIWTKVDGVDTEPVVQARIPTSSFGQFPTSGVSNFRLPTETATLYFGIPGRTGDLLRVVDFGLYPDYRVSVSEGDGLPFSNLSILPDSPHRYVMSENKKPDEIVPGRWFWAGVRPDARLSYRSDTSKVARHLIINRDGAGRRAYAKVETKMDAAFSSEGVMMEAFMSGSSERRTGDLFGAGFSIDDGVNHYQVSMLETDERRTYGLLSNDAQRTVLAGHYLVDEDVDFRTMKLVRLIVDRLRDKIALSVDDTIVLERVLSTSVLPASEGAGARALFGHLFADDAAGQLNVTSLSLLSQYRAYEASDNILPTASSPVFTEEVSSDAGGSSVASTTALTIKKAAFNTVGSERFFQTKDGFSGVGGFLIDFKAKVLSYTDQLGALFAPATSTGAGVTVSLGDKKLQILFVNAGIYGKYVAVMPGTATGGVADVLQQTEAGRRFSAPAAWDEGVRVRVIYRAFKSIEVWVNGAVGEPAITIPWRNDTEGFDLLSDSADPSLSFGHFDGLTSSSVEWSYLRWGSSRGFDVAIQHQHEGEIPSTLFGGKSLVTVDVDELSKPSLGALANQSGAPGEAFSLTPSLTNPTGLTPIFYGLGTFPDGLTVNPSTGELSGTLPASSGTFSGLKIRALVGPFIVDSNEFDLEIELAPVASGLTHWSAADDTPLEPGSLQQVFLDKSGHTFEIDALELKSAFRLRDDDGGAFVPDALNGKRGFLCASGEDYLHLVQMDDSLLTGDAPRGTFVRPSNILGTSWTIQWLVHIPHITVNTQPIFKMVWGPGLNDELHIDCTFQPDVHLHNNSYSIFDAAFDSTPAPPARLLTLRCVAGVVSLYLNNDFVTPVATMTFTTGSPGASNGHIAMQCLAESIAFAPTHFELMTYDRALTDEELAENHAYLSSPSRWGNWT